MPATSKSRSKNASQRVASWQLLAKQFRRWSFGMYGRGILGGIRTALSRHRAGFDWKEIAASLNISGSADSFWNEMKRTPLNQMARRIDSEVIREPKAPGSSQNPNSKPSQ